MKCIIAEKPSVGKQIAMVVGAKDTSKGYLEGNGYIVTWAFGHLCTPALPNAYDAGQLRDNTSIICPKKFKLVVNTSGTKSKSPDSGYFKQLRIIQSCFDQCDSIIVATDAGREGELIFRYIYDYLRCTKPFERLWISSLTSKSIVSGLKNLHPGRDYDNLYMSALCRSQSDWIVGINTSARLCRRLNKKGESLGRVQTPTLSLIVRRYLDNRDFRPSTYYKIHANHLANPSFESVLKGDITSLDQANSILKSLADCQEMRVGNVVQKEVKRSTPLLYDLTSIQKDANTRYGFTASKTLSLLQRLYESKHVTYPRTSSRYITDDIYDEIPSLLLILQNEGIISDREYGAVLNTIGDSKKSVNARRVTDHHALLPTEVPLTDSLSDEAKIYRMIVDRLLQSFSPDAVYRSVVVTLLPDIRDYEFEARSRKILIEGWTAFGQADNLDDSENNTNADLPPMAIGDCIPTKDYVRSEHKTSPKPLLTDASLLALMEGAGKLVESEEEKLALKDCGLGTPATRAAIIEILIQRDYVQRKKKSLVPTARGLDIYKYFSDKDIASVSLTGKWENKLALIEKGCLTREAFIDDIIDYTEVVCNDIDTLKVDSGMENNSEPLVCPKCGKNDLLIYDKLAKCPEEACGFKLWRNICGANLSLEEVYEIVMGGLSGVKSMKSKKTGKAFKARVKLNEDKTGKVDFVFEDVF